MLVKLICTASFIFSKACLYRYSFREGQFCTSNVPGPLKIPPRGLLLTKKSIISMSIILYFFLVTYLFIFYIKPIIRKNKPPSMMFRFLQCCVNHARRMEGRRFEPCWKHFPFVTITFLLGEWADTTAVCPALQFLQIVLNIITFCRVFFPPCENN